jgi:hypothetical protein
MSRCQTNPVPLDRKGRVNDVTIDQVVAALAVAAIFIAPLVAFAAAALRFGTDSRPTIDDPDRRPWLVPSR